jgi:hypothetical protein
VVPFSSAQRPRSRAAHWYIFECLSAPPGSRPVARIKVNLFYCRAGRDRDIESPQSMRVPWAERTTFPPYPFIPFRVRFFICHPAFEGERDRIKRCYELLLGVHASAASACLEIWPAACSLGRHGNRLSHFPTFKRLLRHLW